MPEKTFPRSQSDAQATTVSSELLLKWEADLVQHVKKAIRQAVPRAIEESYEKLGFDEEITGLIHLLAARSNDAKDEVLRKALTLYGLALDAREKGNKLAVISPDDFIVHDVIGFESMVEALGSRND